MNKKQIITTVLVVLVVAGSLAWADWYIRPKPIVPDPVKVEIEDTKSEIQTVSEDRAIHNVQVVERVVTIRAATIQNVRALDPDELVLSIDEFISRWREPEDKHAPGSSRLDH